MRQKKRYAHKILVENPQKWNYMGNPDNPGRLVLRQILTETRCGSVDWNQLA
jgi:hypothetical protein